MLNTASNEIGVDPSYNSATAARATPAAPRFEPRSCTAAPVDCVAGEEVPVVPVDAGHSLAPVATSGEYHGRYRSGKGRSVRTAKLTRCLLLRSIGACGR